MHEGFAHQPAPLVDLGEGADRRQVAGRRVQDERQLVEGFVEAIELDEGAAEGDVRGQVCGVLGEADLADGDGFVRVAVAAELFGELRKSNRRRILLDPASKFERRESSVAMASREWGVMGGELRSRPPPLVALSYGVCAPIELTIPMELQPAPACFRGKRRASSVTSA